MKNFTSYNRAHNTPSWSSDDAESFGSNRWVEFANARRFILLPSIFQMSQELENMISEDDDEGLESSRNRVFRDSYFYKNYTRKSSLDFYETFITDCNHKYYQSAEGSKPSSILGTKIPFLRTKDIVEMYFSSDQIDAIEDKAGSVFSERSTLLECCECGRSGRFAPYMIASIDAQNTEYMNTRFGLSAFYAGVGNKKAMKLLTEYGINIDVIQNCLTNWNILTDNFRYSNINTVRTYCYFLDKGRDATSALGLALVPLYFDDKKFTATTLSDIADISEKLSIEEIEDYKNMGVTSLSKLKDIIDNGVDSYLISELLNS